MNISIEKGRTKRLVGVLLIWLASALLLSLMADLLIGRMKLGSQWISISAAVIVCFSSFAASLVLFQSTNRGRMIMTALLLWLVLASSLLMIGFLISSEKMSLNGLLRVLLSSLIGTFCGAWIKNPGDKRKRAGRWGTRK